jgi:NAD(P)-dependent dehydrogenase (short-subunit alcohol dehydrogenase family)
MSTRVMRRALVTGGASGLGRARARRLRAEHHDVITADIAEGADIRLDVRDDEAVSRLIPELGPIDILLNSAGIVGPSVPLWQTTREEWETTFAVFTERSPVPRHRSRYGRTRLGAERQLRQHGGQGRLGKPQAGKRPNRGAIFGVRVVPQPPAVERPNRLFWALDWDVIQANMSEI